MPKTHRILSMKFNQLSSDGLEVSWPLAVHPPYRRSLSQADLDQLRQTVFPVQDVCVLQCIHQLVGCFTLSGPLLDQRLNAQRCQVLKHRRLAISVKLVKHDNMITIWCILRLECVHLLLCVSRYPSMLFNEEIVPLRNSLGQDRTNKEKLRLLSGGDKVLLTNNTLLLWLLNKLGVESF